MSISAARRTSPRSPASSTTDLGSGPLVNDKTRGERITIRGRVFDGTGTPLRDALVEIWQADADGLYNSPVGNARHGRSEFRRLGALPVATW